MAVTLQQFAEAARRYCEWCEGAPGSQKDEAQTAFNLLVNLLSGFPPVQGGHGGGAGRSIPYDDWKRMHARFASMPFQYYESRHDPFGLGEREREISDLADDLADIWRDLKPGLELYAGNERVKAAAEWKFGFETHWGRHATAALYVLHCWLVDNRQPP